MNSHVQYPLALSRTHREVRGASKSTAVEMAHLRIRAIALERLIVTSQAEISSRRRELAREMAVYLSPEPELAHRPMAHSAVRMAELVERAAHFRDNAQVAGAE
jgi:hypothetical protein